MEKERKVRKFGAIDQVGYMLGDVGGSFVNLYVDAYFMVFCSYVLGISSFFMGTLFLVSRLWDAVNDPLIGSFPDRWKIGKSGDRFKPYIKIAMIPLAISGLLCFMDVSSWGSVGKHVWICFAYILYGMSYTGTSMPYGSLASVVSGDGVERTKLSRARSIGGMIVGICLSIVPMFIWKDEVVNGAKVQTAVPSGFLIVAVIFGVCSLLAYTGLLAITKERIHYDTNKQDYHYGEVLKGVFRNRPLLGAMLATIGSTLAITGQSQFGSYMYKEYYHFPQIVGILSLISLPIMLVLFPIIPSLVKKFGKRNVILAPAGVGLVVTIALFLIPIPNPWVYFALSIVGTLGNNVFAMLVWALVTDCLDYQEVITGTRADGSVYSIFTFARKLGSTMASTLASYTLGWIGFDAAAAKQGLQQTMEVADRIRYLCTGIPVVTCVLLVLGLGLVYNLTMEDTSRISKELADKRAAREAK